MKNNVVKPFSWVLFIAGLLSVVVGFVVINAWLSYAHLDLYSGGQWESTKTKLGKGVWGGRVMMLTNIGLNKEALHLNAWHGHQEITLIDSIPPQKISFSAFPGDVTFSLIINKTPVLTTGVLFDAPGQSISYFQADRAGRFISRQQLPYAAGNWHKDKFEALFLNDSLIISKNGIAIGTFACKLPSAIKPGFRGSSNIRDIEIDDVEMVAAGGKVILSENFNYKFHFYWQAWLYLLAGIGLLGYCFSKTDSLGFAVFAGWLITGAIAICFNYYYHSGSARYSSESPDIDWRHFKSNIETGDDVQQRIAAQYPVAQFADKRKVILLIGSSQTWGAGASDAGSTYGALLQDSLRYLLNDSTLTVINTGVSGTNTDYMLQSFKNYAALYHPSVAVLDVSNNDFDSTVFAKNLEAFVVYNRQHGIQTLMVEEPNDGVTLPSPNHLLMRRLAAQHHITCVEMQPYLIAHSNGGFIWWDEVHMADYGHQLFASRLAPFVAQLLQTDSIPAK